MPRVNLSQNPALGANATGWSGGTRVNVSGFQRPNGYQGGGTTFNYDATGITAGSALLVSFDHKLGATASPKVTITWSTSSGSYIDFTDVIVGNSLSSGVVRRLEAVVTPPANAAQCQLQFKSFPSGSQVTAVLLEHRSNAAAYGDGESSGWQWDGTRYNSTSSEVPGPTVNAGADVESQAVGAVLTRTATASQTITSWAWTIVSGPTGVGSTIGTSATLSWAPTAAGSYVLRASATNASGTGTDDVAVTVYQPSATGEYSIFHLDGAPSTTAAGSFTLATEFYVTEPDTRIVAIRWPRPTTGVNPTAARVETMAGAIVAGTSVTPSGSGTGWQRTELPAPVTLTEGTRYRVLVHYGGTYPTGAAWSPQGRVNGPITAPTNAASTSGMTTTYVSGTSIATPNTTIDGIYWSDVVVRYPPDERITVTDTLAIAEAATAQDAITAADTLAVADTVTITDAENVPVVEQLGVADTVIVSDFTTEAVAAPDSVAVAELVAIAEQAASAEALGVADAATVLEQATSTDALTIAETVTLRDTQFIDFDEPLTVAETVTVLDVPHTAALPLRGGPVYDLSVVALIPQPAGPPMFVEVDGIPFESLSYTATLSRPGELSATCLATRLPDSILELLRPPVENLLELHLTRDGRLVFAGPLYGYDQAQGEKVTLQALGLLSYLRRMRFRADKTFMQVDQFAMVAFMIDQWQSVEWGHYGLDTSSVGASGVLRDGTYLRDELRDIAQRVDELGARINGFDIEADPQTRRVQLWHPTKGVDRSSGEDAVVFDAQSLESSDVSYSVAPEDLASEAFGTGTGGDATLFASAVNQELLTRIGRSAVSGTFDGVSVPATLADHVQALLDARSAPLVVPGPKARITSDTDLETYDVGDTVRLEIPGPLGVSGAYRLRSQTVTVAESGQETVAIEFV